MLKDQPLRLDPEQQRAIEAALHNNLTIISGGPGTGKTSIVLTLVRCLIRGGIPVDRVALAAPTGRAAQRLSDSLRFPDSTIWPRPRCTPSSAIGPIATPFPAIARIRYRPTW